MGKFLSAFLMVIFCTSLYSQNFHEEDKEGLRNILRQMSSQNSKSNLECLGLTTTDTVSWNVSEEWITVIHNNIGAIYVDWEWSIATPSRLIRLEINSFTDEYQLSGILDCNYFQELEILNFSGSSFGQLKVWETPKLKQLDCSDNDLTELDLSRCVSLWQLNCSGNKLTEIDLSTNQDLGVLNCSNNLISILDVSKQKNLNSLYCSDNEITNLSLSANLELVSLDCSNNLISQLDWSKNDKLEFLSCSGNPLDTEINLSSKTMLRSFYGSDIQASTLVAPQSEELALLYFPYNNVSSLNVAQNTNLEYLYCFNNKLTSLDLLQNTKLDQLNCSYNQLEVLKIDSQLSSLLMNNNNLRFSTMQVNPALNHNIMVYSPQKIIDAGEIEVEDIIDLNSEYRINGTFTTFNWYNESEDPITLPYLEDGRFEANISYVNQIITCKMTNAFLPDLTVIYQVKIVDTITGIKEDKLRNEVLIYPNPVSDILHIEAQNPIKGIKLYDMVGRVVRIESQESIKYEISVSELPAGMYILKTRMASGNDVVYKMEKK